MLINTQQASVVIAMSVLRGELLIVRAVSVIRHAAECERAAFEYGVVAPIFRIRKSMPPLLKF